MNANELRIGNLLIYNGMVMRLSEICSPKPMKDKRYSDKWILELFDGAGLLSCTIDEVEPIEITKEELLKFGYELMVTGTYLQPNSGNFVWFDEDLECSIADEYIVFRIKYIHQLQNLVFDLYGKELTYKN